MTTLTASPVALARFAKLRIPAAKAKPKAPHKKPVTSSSSPVVASSDPVPPPAAPAANNKRARQAAARMTLVELLREMFPAVFCDPPVPLAIGIYTELVAALDGMATGQELGRALRWWTTRNGYRNAVAHLEMRRHLDGSPAGEPTEDQAHHAAAAIYRPAQARIVVAEALRRRERTPAAAE